MGFFDGYEDTGGISYVSGEEKAVLIKNEVPLEVIRIFESDHAEYGPKYNIVITLDGEERVISFKKGSVFSRDRMLAAMREYLEAKDEGEPNPEVVIYKVKQSQLLRDANAEPEAEG